MEHDTGLKLFDDIMLRRLEVKNNRQNYSIHSMSTNLNSVSSKVPVHEISHNIFVASTQFEQPFDYSSSSWVKDNECHKNVSKLKVVHRHYEMDSQVVNVIIQSTTEPFRYFLKSVDNPPYIRFTVPGENINGILNLRL